MVGKTSESDLISGAVCTTGISDNELSDDVILARLNVLSDKGNHMTDAEIDEHIHLLALCNKDMLNALSKI